MPEEDRDLDAEWTNALRAIAMLDEIHERGEIAATEYQRRRAELCSQAKVILQARQADLSPR